MSWKGHILKPQLLLQLHVKLRAVGRKSWAISMCCMVYVLISRHDSVEGRWERHTQTGRTLFDLSHYTIYTLTATYLVLVRCANLKFSVILGGLFKFSLHWLSEGRGRFPLGEGVLFRVASSEICLQGVGLWCGCPTTCWNPAISGGLETHETCRKDLGSSRF